MIDLVKDFGPYLEKWCKDNHKPMPKKINKYWQQAWEDYMKTDLVKNWEANKEAYLNMPLLTKQQEKELELQDSRENDTLEESELNEPSPSSWEQVKKYLNK